MYLYFHVVGWVFMGQMCTRAGGGSRINFFLIAWPSFLCTGFGQLQTLHFSLTMTTTASSDHPSLPVMPPWRSSCDHL